MFSSSKPPMMPVRQRTASLHLSERSNGLQFQRSFHFHDSYHASKAASRRPQNAHKRTYSVSSLLPPYVPGSSKLRSSNRTSSKRRSISSMSIRSFASSLSRRRKPTVPANLNTIPFELVDEIASYCDQKTLLALALTCRAAADSAILQLYAYPTFASTYRLAQFVHQVSHNPNYAFRVRSLDLSGFASIDPEEPVAGWREWKHRNNPIYTLQREKSPPPPPPTKGRRHWAKAKIPGPVEVPKPKSSHPPANPRLMLQSTNKDVPVGALLHICKACPNIECVNLSMVPLSQDYAIVSQRRYKATAFTQLLFVSDVQKQYTGEETDMKPLSIHNDLVNALVGLKRLREVTIKGSTWVNKAIVKRFVYECKKLKMVDVSGSGMVPKAAWATSAKTEHMKMIIDELERN